MPLAAKGYAVASINYRLSQHAVFPAQIEDCKAAIRWLRANAAKYHLDPDHIGVWGASAGGHLVALLGTTGSVKELEGKGGNLDQSSRVQCVVDWFGPTDLATMGGSHDKPGSPESRLIGGPVQENKEKARKASPLTYVSKDSAPFLIMHGDQDNTVPPGTERGAGRGPEEGRRGGHARRSSRATGTAGRDSTARRTASSSRTSSPSISARAGQQERRSTFPRNPTLR